MIIPNINRIIIPRGRNSRKPTRTTDYGHLLAGTPYKTKQENVDLKSAAFKITVHVLPSGTVERNISDICKEESKSSIQHASQPIDTALQNYEYQLLACREQKLGTFELNDTLYEKHKTNF